MRAGPLAVAAAALALVPTYPLAAQHFSIGPQVAFGDYRETTSDLHYRGGGVGAKASVVWKKFSADVWLSKVKYKPEGGTATTDFDASEVDVQLRYYISGPFSAELGFMNRKADPEFEAQSMGRSEERRVGKECGYGWWAEHYKKDNERGRREVAGK